jgi:hypothetical protein
MIDSPKYGIFKNVLASNIKLAISEDDYLLIKDARNVCSLALDLEENFFVVCEAYRELESATLEISLHSMMYNITSSDDFYLRRTTLSQKLVAFLSAVRLYTDSVRSICKSMTGIEKTQKDVTAIFATKYDSSIDYRLFEALRNYVQHSALPVHSISIGSKANDDFSAIANFTEFNVSLDELKNNDKFKKPLLKQLEKLLEEEESAKRKPKKKSQSYTYDLKMGVRKYFSLLRDCHEEFQSITDAALKASEDSLQSYVTKWEAENTDGKLDSRYLVATRMEGEYKHPNAVDIYLQVDSDKLRLKLRSMTRGTKNIHKNFVRY